MYCLVDFRNRPQFQHTFHAREKARECVRKIKNNPLGVTAIYPDGRREYFENGLPAMLPAIGGIRAGLTTGVNNLRIQKGYHVKYAVRKLNTLDGLIKKRNPNRNINFSNWKEKSIFSLFMLGNQKLYALIAIASLLIFSSSFYFQKQYSQTATAEFQDLRSFRGQVAGAMDVKTENDETADSLQLADEEIIMNLLGKIQAEKQGEFEKEITKYIKGRPMEKMAPYIAKQDRIVAAFIVGIAMKESKFGVYAPHSGGRDCYNYWGYKGRENTTASGYSCFNSPEHAIQVVGKKIASLTARGISNPAEMISWKCGSSCAGHGAEDVRKWIADVGIYFSKINS